MAELSTDTGYIVWGIDQTAYGPVELPTLVAWIKDERVTADTWVFSARNEGWQKASQISELQMFFRKRVAAGNGPPAPANAAPGPGVLRRVKILAGMTDEQIGRFAKCMEIEKVPQ